MRLAVTVVSRPVVMSIKTDKMTQPYVYRLIDRVTGTQYIGVRYAKNCAPRELGVSYFTSSTRIKSVYRDDSFRFEKQIIVTGSKEYVVRVEKSLLDFYDAVNSSQFYNRTNNKAIHSDDCVKGGLLGGKENAKSGHMSKLGKKFCSVGGVFGGRVTGLKNKESGQILRLAKSNNSMRYTCVICGLTSTPSGVGRHQQISKHVGREVARDAGVRV